MAESKAEEIPSSARVWESAVLNKDVDTVWKAVRAVTFEWASDVKKTEINGDASAVGGTRCINYNDGTKQTVQIMEISDLRKSVTYSVLTSEPALSSSYIYIYIFMRICVVLLFVHDQLIT